MRVNFSARCMQTSENVKMSIAPSFVGKISSQKHDSCKLNFSNAQFENPIMIITKALLILEVKPEGNAII